MSKKLFITDCEGPLSINDNAFELSEHFIPQGDKFFQAVSKYDDILVDEIKKPGYNAGDTLKLIVPFLKAYGLNNKKMIEFSSKTVQMVPGAKETINLAYNMMHSFIVSTSYQQYIEALCNLTGFPVENTYSTQTNLDTVSLSTNESEKLKNIKDIIVDGADFDTMDKIFFQEIPSMEIGKILPQIKTVGGVGKKLAVEDILNKTGLTPDKIMYIGDSITDVEPLALTRGNKGISVSFNGNEFAIKAAEIAIISNHTIVTSLLMDLHSRFNSTYIKQFLEAYTTDPERALSNFRVNLNILKQFEEVFASDLPIMEIITPDNQEYLLTESMKSRKNIRGESIGGLG